MGSRQSNPLIPQPRLAAAVAPAAAATSDFLETIMKYTFYISLFLLTIYSTLLIINYTIYPIFTSTYFGRPQITLATTDNQQTFMNKLALPDISANFAEVSSYDYTVAFDIFIENSLPPTNGPRVLTYRGTAAALDTSTSSPAYAFYKNYVNNDQQSNLMTGVKATFPKTNLLLYIHPIKNDLYAAVLLEDNTVRISKPVINVPVSHAFRLTVTMNENALEIYLNGRLSQTMVWDANVLPIDSAGYDFWSPSSDLNKNVYIANMIVWNRILTPREIRSNGTPINLSTFNSVTS
jgi:hypothetical protein